MKKLNITALSVMLALGLTACQPPEAEKSAPAASGASGASSANADGTVNVGVNDTACEPMELTVPSGQVVFNIKNNSGRKLEWEILKGVMVVDERDGRDGRLRRRPRSRRACAGPGGHPRRARRRRQE